MMMQENDDGTLSQMTTEEEQSARSAVIAGTRIMKTISGNLNVLLSPASEAQVRAEWSANDAESAELWATRSAEAQRRQAINADTAVADLRNRLNNASLQQISDYVDANVTDLASARALFKRILAMMAAEG